MKLGNLVINLNLELVIRYRILLHAEFYAKLVAIIIIILCLSVNYFRWARNCNKTLYFDISFGIYKSTLIIYYPHYLA